jgi:hypothetical protein
MDKLTEMVTSYYPMSTESQIVFSNSIKSWQMQSNTMIDYESQDFSMVPVFVGRLLSKMEEKGIRVNSLSDTDETITYRHKSNLDEFLEVPDYGFKSEEITSLIQEDIIKTFTGKELSIFTIIPHVNKNEKSFECYIRMKSHK